MAEICAALPSAGSVYHWSGAPAATGFHAFRSFVAREQGLLVLVDAGQLASPRWAPLVSYIDGYINFIGNAAGDAFFGYAWASQLNDTIFYGKFDYNAATPMTERQLVGVAIAVCLVWSILNALRVDQQGWVNNFAATFQVREEPSPLPQLSNLCRPDLRGSVAV